MVRTTFMVIAGEPSGDLLGAELVRALRPLATEREFALPNDYQPRSTSLPPSFFGAGGMNLAAAGVDLAFDMTQHAVVGLFEVMRDYAKFRRLFRQLFELAIARQPDAIICIDFSGFNLRFLQAIRRHSHALRATFGNWDPLLVQYVSPQVWASRPERARRLANYVDLVLSIVPFEKNWYEARIPKLPVEYVGHPLVDRYAALNRLAKAEERGHRPDRPELLLLPGSRRSEIKWHLPVLIEALAQIRTVNPRVHARLILPNDELVRLARAYDLPPDLELSRGGLASALASTTVAIASTGTVTLECAYAGVPTVALYRTSWPTYWLGKQLIQVRYLAMPNLLVEEEVFPEFIQQRATAPNLARAALELLEYPARRKVVQSKLVPLIASLGPPGASARAARAIFSRMKRRPIRAALRDRG